MRWIDRLDLEPGREFVAYENGLTELKRLRDMHGARHGRGDDRIEHRCVQHPVHDRPAESRRRRKLGVKVQRIQVAHEFTKGVHVLRAHEASGESEIAQG